MIMELIQLQIHQILILINESILYLEILVPNPDSNSYQKDTQYAGIYDYLFKSITHDERIPLNH
jgi:hypothetical protein